MKRSFDIAVLLTLAGLMMACTKVEKTDTPERIAYSVGSYAHTTKAGELSLNEDEGITAFSSKAFLHDRGQAVGSEYFSSTISWDETSRTWSPSQDYFWPKHPQSYLNFVSWYASAGITPTTVTETAFSITREIAPTDRILLADVAWRYSSNQSTYNLNGAAPGVPTLFHHMLTSLTIKVGLLTATDPIDAGTTYSVTLQDVTLMGHYCEGSMDMTNQDNGTTRTWAWESEDEPVLYWSPTSGTDNTPKAIVSSNTMVSTTPVAVLDNCSMMPQQLTDNVVLHVVFSLSSTKNGNVTYREDDIAQDIVLNTVKNTSDVAIVSWVPNKKYTYNLIIDPTTSYIYFNPTMEESWGLDQDNKMYVE